MDIIKPFYGIRPSFINLLDQEKHNLNTNSNMESKKIKNFYEDIKVKDFIRDEIASYYICQIESMGFTSCGLIALINMSHDAKKIYCHEETLDEKIEMMCNVFMDCNMQNNPILIVHRTNENIEELIRAETDRDPDSQYISKFNCIYKLWIVNHKQVMDILTSEMNKINHFHLADGHHRFAAMKKISTNNNNHFVMAFLASDKNIVSKSYHRLIFETCLTFDILVKNLSKYFNITYVEKPIKKPENYEYFLYINQKWLLFTLKDFLKQSNNYGPAVIDKYFFKSSLNIQDQRGNQKIKFVPESHSFFDLKYIVDNSKDTMALFMPPLEINDFFSVCQQDILLPPHSTYFEPKIINQMISYQF